MYTVYTVDSTGGILGFGNFEIMLAYKPLSSIVQDGILLLMDTGYKTGRSK